MATRRKFARSECAIGPCADGGFYALGLTRCPRGLLRGLPWSSPDTFARTVDRLRSRGLAPIVLEESTDVDRPEDLARLHRLLERGEANAPRTFEILRELECAGIWRPAELSAAEQSELDERRAKNAAAR